MPSAPATPAPTPPAPEPAPAEPAPAVAESAPPSSVPAPATPEPAAPVPAAPEPAAPNPAETVARFDGYRDLRFGMSAAEVKKAWGSGLKRDPKSSDSCFYLDPGAGWSKVGLSFMIENGKFVRYDVGNKTDTAPGGGKVGMSTREIQKLYAGRIKLVNRPYLDGAYNLRIEDAAGGKGVLLFETDLKGTVTGWRVGLVPPVDYMEGCS
ncbi:lectin [Vitiosangium sp. GDMCC 1.1324]|nr:lectin [Vitiosangium sp. GDMCC 1.1324]